MSHLTHAHSAWLKMFKGEKNLCHRLAFTSISFLDVFAQYPSLSVPTCSVLTYLSTIQTFSVLNVHGKELEKQPRYTRWSGMSGRLASPAPNTETATLVWITTQCSNRLTRRRLASSQTETSSLLAPNVSVARQCCSNQVSLVKERPHHFSPDEV